MTTISIRGEGVAALCCARLLGETGFDVSVERLNQPKLPSERFHALIPAVLRSQPRSG
jgi:hypothetical protein